MIARGDSFHRVLRRTNRVNAVSMNYRFSTKTRVDIDVDNRIGGPHNLGSLVANQFQPFMGQPDLLRCNGLHSIEIFLKTSMEATV